MQSATPSTNEDFIQLKSKWGGLCRGCGGSYTKGETIAWSRVHGPWHIHCQELSKDPKERNAAMFQSAIVDALQHRCAELEQENLMLTGKCSHLERIVRGEEL
jgi:fatty-acid desaturase